MGKRYMVPDINMKDFMSDIVRIGLIELGKKRLR